MTFDAGGQSPQPTSAPPQPAPQPQAAWAMPPQTIVWRETKPLEYHELYRGTPRYRWWKPLLALVLGAIYYLTMQVGFMFVVFGIYAAQGGSFSLDTIDDLVVLDTQNPWSIAMNLGAVALMIPAVWLAMLSVQITPIGRGWSVALRIRWRWIWRTILPAIVALMIMNFAGVAIEIASSGLLPGADGQPQPEIPQIDLTLALISLGIVVVLMPIQAAAEELVFRGMFMQTLGAWLGSIRSGGAVRSFLRGPWIPILVPSILFGFAHIYDIWGLLAVMIMGVAAAWLTWRTGGLEAAITVHVMNNLVAFGFLAFALGGETRQTADGGTPGALIGQVIGLGLYCWWVDRDFRRNDARRSRIDYVQVRETLATEPLAPAPQGAPGAPGAS